MKRSLLLFLCAVTFVSCATFEAPPRTGDRDGLIVAQIGLRTTEESSIEDEYVEVTDVATGEVRLIELSPRGLMMVAGSSGDRFRLTAVVITASAQVDAGTGYRLVRTPEGLVGVPEQTRRTTTVAYRLRYPVADGPLLTVRPATVMNMGRLEARVSGLFEAQFRGRSSGDGGLAFRSDAPSGDEGYVDMGPVRLRPRDGHDRVRRLFTGQFDESAWVEAGWSDWAAPAAGDE